jgi:hypothetical protein
MLCVPSVTAPEPEPAGPRAAGGGDAAAAPERCPGREIQPDRVITGEFGAELQKAYVMLPFEVPPGTTAVRVKYCHDQPELAVPGVPNRHTLDLGLYEPRPPGKNSAWGVEEFRGWGGSSHSDVTVSAEGFSTEEQYLASPRVDPPGRTTRAFRPGPVKPGRWAVELGVAGVVGPALGDSDGRVAWRVEIALPSDPAFADEPYRPAAYHSRPARREPGWYSGDLHVHGEHSAYGDATMSELLGYAFRPIAEGGAGLDFITLSDYVSGSAWGEVGRYQGSHPGKLIARSAEVITYRGHVNNHNTASVVDYREGPIYERRADGSLDQLRGQRPASALFDDIHARGGYTQINHPTIFPSDVPPFGLLCRGCSWEYSDEETRYERADAIEIATGPAGLKTQPETGPNPFTVTALAFYERALAAGHRIAAVGVSDSHRAGRVGSGPLDAVTQAPIGEATTVVRAAELSEAAVECAVEAGHTYVKVGGNEGPDLRFEALPAGGAGPPAIFGDTVQAARADFTARVLGGPGRTLLVLRDGAIVQEVPVAGGDFSHSFSASEPGRYGLRLMRGQNVESVGTPIWVEPGEGRVDARDCTPLSVRGSVRRRVRRGAFRVRCTAAGGGLRSCGAEAVIRTRRSGRLKRWVIGRASVRMAPGRRSFRVRLNRRGRRVLRRHPRGRRFRVVFTAADGDGAQARHVRRAGFRRKRR